MLQYNRPVNPPAATDLRVAAVAPEDPTTSAQSAPKTWSPPVEKIAEKLPLIVRLALIFCAIAAFSGPLKEVPPFMFSPLDLTMVATVAAFGFGVVALIHQRTVHIGRPTAVLIVLTAMVAAGAINNVPSDYGALKTTRLVIVTLPAIAALAIVARDRLAARYFLGAATVLAAAQALWINVGGERQYGFGRLTTELGTTISFGRAAGFLVIAGAAWVISAKSIGPTQLAASGALVALGTWTMFAVASKGPVLGVTVGLATMLVLQLRRLALRNGLRVLGMLVVLSVAFAGVWSRIPELSRERFLGFGEGGSAGVRQEAWDFTWQQLTGAPIGHGWGSWNDVAPVSIVYPHNILLEVWFEAGVLGIVFLLAALWLGVAPSFRYFAADRFLATFALGSVVYWMATALVSGDMNDNKAPMMMIVIAAAMAVEPPRIGSTAEVRLPTGDAAAT